jgi:hypothetical protein
VNNTTGVRVTGGVSTIYWQLETDEVISRIK